VCVWRAEQSGDVDFWRAPTIFSFLAGEVRKNNEENKKSGRVAGKIRRGEPSTIH
jgi:hypothetical protein